MAHRNRRRADIDITPLIDVLFMLIIFFVLTTSFARGKLDVQLPSGEGSPKGMEGAVIVTVDKDGKIFWKESAVTKDELKQLAASSAGRDVLVAGDRNVPYGDIATVLTNLRSAGVSDAGLMLSGEKTE